MSLWEFSVSRFADIKGIWLEDFCFKRKESPPDNSSLPTLITSQPIFSYPFNIFDALKRSEFLLESVNTEYLNNKSPASKIKGSKPCWFSCLIVVYFLDRPPSGFFGQPQGSS